MKQIILIVALLAHAATGQSVENQKACDVQAQNVSSKDAGVKVSNHYDVDNKTCWVKEIQIIQGTKHVSIYNTSKLSSESEFSSTPSSNRIVCWVRDIKCKNLAEFEKLVKQQYGF